MHQRAGQRQPLFEAKGQLIRGVGSDSCQAKRLAHPVDFLVLGAPSQAVNAGEKAQVLLDRQVAVQRELLRHIPQMLARLAGADFQIHIQYQRFAGRRHQQATHHLKGGGFPRAVWPEQAKNFTALHREIDVIGGGEITEFFGQGFGFDHRLTRRTFYRVQDRPERRFRSTRTAQQIDKRVFKAGSRLFHLNVRHARRVTNIRFGRLFGQDHAHRTALNHPVADLGQLQHPLQQFAVRLLRAVHQETASGHALGQLRRFSLIKQLAFVHQQHIATLLGFIQIGGAPEDQHSVTGQLVHHLPQLAA